MMSPQADDSSKGFLPNQERAVPLDVADGSFVCEVTNV
jgi:hypothetical protein